jgi:hypothetical protein
MESLAEGEPTAESGADPGITPEVVGASDAPAETPHWTAGYPSTAGDPVFERMEGVETLIKSYRELSTVLSSAGTKAPGEKASTEEWGAFYDKMGRPTEAGGYFEGISRPEGDAWNDDLAVALAVEMREQGLSAKQGNALLSRYIEATGADLSAFNENRATAHARSVQALRDTWGGDYDLRLAEADNGGKAAFGEGWKGLVSLQLADGSVLGNHTAFAQGLQSLGNRLGENSLLGVESATAHGYTRESALAKIKELEGDGTTETALICSNPEHPLHEETNRKMMDLYNVAHREG